MLLIVYLTKSLFLWWSARDSFRSEKKYYTCFPMVSQTRLKHRPRRKCICFSCFTWKQII